MKIWVYPASLFALWMMIIHTVNESPLPRHLQAGLMKPLRVMPAVVATGARQTGKSTHRFENGLPGSAGSCLSTISMWRMLLGEILKR